jgi:hypothetical protein
MPRGGKRDGAGARFKWKHGKTKTIRVPIELVDEILAIAQKLDSGETFVFHSEKREIAIIDYDTQSKLIDLSGVSLVSVSGQMGVKLSDLILKGYKIKPDHLNSVITKSLAKK